MGPSRSQIITILALVLPTPLTPASAQTILGRAKDGSGKTLLRNIEVDLVPDTGATTVVLARATTDSGGTFFIDAPSLGTYRLLFKLANAPMLTAPIPLTSTTEPVQREFRLEIPAPHDYVEIELEHMVRPMPGGSPPRYPSELYAAGVEGEVLARFVVDTTGKADMETFRIIKSTDGAFTQAVRISVPTLNFQPAELHGAKVRQVVQMPFLFCFSGPVPARARADTSRYWYLTRARPAGCTSR